MAWIKLPEDEATPELARTTRPWRREGRPVPSVVAVMKPRPSTLRAVLRMNDAVIYGSSGLGRQTEDLVAATVSALNDCFY